MLFVSHDLAVVRSISDEVMVLKEGEIVEKSSAEEVFNNPKHIFKEWYEFLTFFECYELWKQHRYILLFFVEEGFLNFSHIWH